MIDEFVFILWIISSLFRRSLQKLMKRLELPCLTKLYDKCGHSDGCVVRKLASQQCGPRLYCAILCAVPYASPYQCFLSNFVRMKIIQNALHMRVHVCMRVHECVCECMNTFSLCILTSTILCLFNTEVR